MTCPYCGKEARWCENREIYGRNYGRSYMCYYCVPCDAHVGCHQNSRKPLGTMANSELRLWRVRTHEAFDPIWKSGRMSRKKAYKLLEARFGREIHIGGADIETCMAVVEFCKGLT